MSISSLNDIETFVAIVEAGSFTAAARRQGLTVNAVSRRLQQLERSLGTQLMERTTRRSTPTDAGRRLHRKAVEILDALVEAEADVQRSRTEVAGLVRLALPPALVTASFLSELERLLETHRGLRVDLRVASQQLPGEAGVDLAVVTEPPPATLDLISRRVGVQGWGLAASPGYVRARGLPSTPEQLSSHSCLRFRGDTPQRVWTLTTPRGKSVVVNVDGAFECDDSRVLGDAIYAGLGVGVRPESEIREAAKRKVLVPVLPGWRFGERPAYLLTTKGRRGLPRVSVVSELVIAAIKRLT